MRSLLPILIFASTTAFAAPMTNQQAADMGKALGQTQDALITPQINQTNANANIKHLTPSPSETQFFGGGKADNFAPGDAKRIECDTGAKNPDAFAQQSCDAVNLVAKAPKQRPAYTVGRNDPMLQREQAVRANASTVATAGMNTANNPNGFGIAGTYSGCTTTTTPDPATTETKLCTDYLTATQATTTNNCQKSVKTTQSCHKVMSFTVTQGTPVAIKATSTTTTTYQAGSFLWTGSMWDYLAGSTIFVSSAHLINAPTDGNGTSYCPASGLYSYTPDGVTSYYVCIASSSTTTTYTYSCPSGTTPLPSPAISTSKCYPPPTITETYTDGCAALQAKTQ